MWYMNCLLVIVQGERAIVLKSGKFAENWGKCENLRINSYKNRGFALLLYELIRRFSYKNRGFALLLLGRRKSEWLLRISEIMPANS